MLVSNIKLFKHQEDALDQTEGQNRVAYYLDMGLGKTFVGSEKMVQLGKRINLVVCQKSKVQDWIDHFSEHYMCGGISESLYPRDLTKEFDFDNFFYHVDEIQDGSHYVGVVNYDLIFRRPQFKQLQDFTLMLDESSLIQNAKTKRTKFILKMNPSNVIMLSGTPTSGKYENLWTQIHLLGWTISQDTYNKQYINWTLTKDDGSGIRHKIVDKADPYKNVDRLKEKMREHGAVFMKTEECFDLPEQTFITVNCESTKEYRKFKKDSIVKIGEIELIGDSTLTKRLYSRMLCGHYNKEKLEAFKDLVESTNDRLVVFYNFNEELNQLKNIAEELERPISEVNGHIKDLDAFENEDASITFVQYQAGAKGLNLQKANKIIYFTPTEKCEDWMQSQKRTHRIKQTKPCFYYKLICKGSIEENIYESLERGVDFTNDLFINNMETSQ
jgi:SNF2 family DNA or RNA helicase